MRVFLHVHYSFLKQILEVFFLVATYIYLHPKYLFLEVQGTAAAQTARFQSRQEYEWAMRAHRLKCKDHKEDSCRRNERFDSIDSIRWWRRIQLRQSAVSCLVTGLTYSTVQYAVIKRRRLASGTRSFVCKLGGCKFVYSNLLILIRLFEYVNTVN